MQLHANISRKNLELVAITDLGNYLFDMFEKLVFNLGVPVQWLVPVVSVHPKDVCIVNFLHDRAQGATHR